MKCLLPLLACLVPLALAASVPKGDIHISKDMDKLDELSEKEFEEYFNRRPITDKKELKARSEALKHEEEQVKENNIEYAKGNSSFYEGINKYSDLTHAEFLAQRTGLGPTEKYGRGLIMPPMEERYDPVDEAWFDRLRFDRSQLPASFSSVDYGWVTPVKSQQTCASCAAFTAVAAVEICFARVTGVQGDYSEQQLLDCGKGYKNRASGCEGAWPDAYFQYLNEKSIQLAHESQVPYKNKDDRCPSNQQGYNQGAKVSGEHTTYQGNEELVKKLVYNYGSAAVALHAAHSAFQNYKGGIFTGCWGMGSNLKLDHAVTVVGYGTENGQDYWLVKNSWGKDWGEKGFAKIIRGYQMCGIGTGPISAVTCEATSGATDAPLTTEVPCLDSWANDMSNPCPEYAKTRCGEEQIQKGCTKSCGMCGKTETQGSCTCSSYVDSNGYGKCQKTWNGKALCFVETPSTCSDLADGGYSFAACEGSKTETQGSCTCSSYVDSYGYGKCQKTWNGKALCYVQTPSTCSDLKDGYSFQACTGRG